MLLRRYRLLTLVLVLLACWCGLRAEHEIADIGSGTGFLTRVFLDFGNRVYGVEPNAEMRLAGEELLCGYAKFASIAGSAEATTLPADSVDFVTVGQAFHWFPQPASREEFRRILRAGGRVVVVWNERLIDDTPFLRDYEALLLRFGTDYAKVSESYPRAEQMLAFFHPNEFSSHAVPYFQEFDFEGLSGRLRSSSYAPAPGHPQFAPMIEELQRIFDQHHQNDRVRMEYRTRVYAGKLDYDRKTA